MERLIQFHLEDFEGPLDLLLALVQKNKMSIYEIEILTLIDQYLEIVGEPVQNPAAMDTSSEFITMAAHLVQMKSAMLLPRNEEAERMREELTGLLVEYNACKEVAGKLREMAANVYIIARRPANIELDHAYRGTHSISELTDAFAGIMGRSSARRAPSSERFDEIVTTPIVSVTGRIIHLLRGMTNGMVSRLKDAFAACRSRGETVATFLALLELIRGGRVTISDDEDLALQKNTRKHPKREATSDGT